MLESELSDSLSFLLGVEIENGVLSVVNLVSDLLDLLFYRIFVVIYEAEVVWLVSESYDFFSESCAACATLCPNF